MLSIIAYMLISVAVETLIEYFGDQRSYHAATSHLGLHLSIGQMQQNTTCTSKEKHKCGPGTGNSNNFH